MGELVCVVDDDDIFRDLVVQMLEAEGFATVATGDPTAVQQLVSQVHPAALVIDILMPEQDGLEVIGQVRKAHPDLRIVAMSSGGRVGPDLLLRTARALGACKALPKGFTSAELRDAILQPRAQA